MSVFDEPASSFNGSMLPSSQNTHARAAPGAWLNSPLIETDVTEVTRCLEVSIPIAPTQRGLDGVGHVLGQPPKSTMTTNLDAFRILELMVYYLSNRLEGFKEIRETILFFVEQVPQSLVVEFLQAGSPAIEACWMPLAEWSFELHQKQLFEQIMQVSLRCAEWVKLHGARCLIFAAYFDCDRIVRDIIARGVSPNEPVKFEIDINHEGTQTPSFFGLSAVEWFKSQYIYRSFCVETSPLLEAAARNNKSTLGVLKDAEVDCQVRSGGLTAAGHALISHRRGAMDIDGFFDTLTALIDMGEIIDAPLWEAGLFCSERNRELTETNPIWSEETLLDSIYIEQGDCSFFQHLQKQSLVPSGVLTVSGILRSASGGRGDLQRYMVTSHYPKGLPRKRIEEIALVRSLAIPAAFESLMGNGFSLELETLIRRDNVGVSGGVNLPSESDWEAVSCLLSRLCEIPDTVAQYIIDWISEDRVDEVFSSLDEVHGWSEFPIQKLAPSQIKRLGPRLLERCMGNYSAVKMCLEAGISHQGIDLLDLAKNKRSETIDTDVLELLYDHGSRPVFSLRYLHGMSDYEGYDMKMLKWLVRHGLLLDGLSIYDIIVLFNVNFVPWTELRDLGQWFATRGHCLYTWPPSTSLVRPADGCKNFISLSLVIYLGGSIDLISRLLEEDLDIDERRPAPYSFRPSDEANWKGDSALEAAVRKCDVSMIKALLHHGADINSRSARGWTVLGKSVASYVRASQADDRAVRQQIIRYLLENGADTNERHESSIGEKVSRSLGLAVRSPSPDLQLIQLLLDSGARPHDSTSPKPLIRSLAEKVDSKLKREVSELLIANGALYQSSEELVRACILSDIELVHLHIQKGADPNAVIEERGLNLPRNFESPKKPFEIRNSYFRPLEASAGRGNVPIALVLLAAGAALSGEDHSLSLASENGRLDMVALLLPLEKRLEEVERALKSALTRRHYSIIQLLRQQLATWTSES